MNKKARYRKIMQKQEKIEEINKQIIEALQQHFSANISELIEERKRILSQYQSLDHIEPQKGAADD